MTRDERHIAVLNRMLENMDVYDSIQPTTERKKAIKAAIQALSQEPCDDAISREAAINIASLHCLTIDETVKAIKNLPSVTQKSAKDYLDMADRKAKKIKDALTDNPQKSGKWIPVSERLPEDGTWNLFTDGKNVSVERYKYDVIDHFYPNGRWFSLDEVIAWMPLPEPYKGRK